MPSLLSGCWETREPTRGPNLSEDWSTPDKCWEFSDTEEIEGECVSTPIPADTEKMQLLLASIASDWKTKLQTVVSFEVFRKELTVINSRLDRLEQQAPLVVPIQSLAPEPYELVKPIQAVVQFMDDEYVASFFDANLSTGGDTQVEAISNLKDLIIGTFELLTETNDSELGPGPSHQKAVLREFVRVR